MTRHQYNNDRQVWNFGARFSDVIWRENQWWRRQMSAVFSGFVNGFITSYIMFGCHWTQFGIFLIKIKKIKFGREKPLVKFIYSNNHRQSVCSCLHPKAGIVTRCKHLCFSLFISFFRDRSGTRQRGRNMAWNEQRWKIWSDHKLQTSAKVYESPGTWERPSRARFFKGG